MYIYISICVNLCLFLNTYIYIYVYVYISVCVGGLSQNEVSFFPLKEPFLEPKKDTSF